MRTKFFIAAAAASLVFASAAVPRGHRLRRHPVGLEQLKKGCGRRLGRDEKSNRHSLGQDEVRSLPNGRCRRKCLGKDKEGYGFCVGKTKEGTAKAWDKTKEGSSEVWDKTKSGSAKLWDKTKQGAKDSYDAAKSKTKELLSE